MRTEAITNLARRKLSALLARQDLAHDQRATLSGMSVALQWVCGDGGDTLQRIVDDEPIEARGSKECRDCGNWNTCGDCIPEFCPDCRQRRDKAKTDGVDGRCRDCGAVLLHSGECFDCTIFGKPSPRPARSGS